MIAAPHPAVSLEAALRARGLLPDPSRALPQPGPGRPWFVSALLGVSGWLAGLFFLGFAAQLFGVEHAPGFASLGLVLLWIALAVLRTAKGAFLEQGALALSIAGHCLLGAAAYDATESVAATAWAVAVLQAGWIAVVPARLPRFLATIFAVTAVTLAVRILVAGGERALWRDEETVGLGPALLGWAGVWVPVAVAAGLLVRKEVRWMAAGRQGLVRPVLTGLLVTLALASPAAHPESAFSALAGEAAPAGWLALWPLCSLGASLWALWLAHRLRSAALVGTAIAGALLHVFHFYMLLGLTLLAKSVILLVVGAALVGLAVALRHGEAA